MENIKVEINPIPLSPLSKCFDHRLKKKDDAKKDTEEAGTQAQIVQTPIKLSEMGTMTHVQDSPLVAYQLNDYQDKIISKILDDKKIKSIQKFVSKLGSILGETVNLGKLKPDSYSQQSYSNLSTVD